MWSYRDVRIPAAPAPQKTLSLLVLFLPGLLQGGGGGGVVGREGTGRGRGSVEVPLYTRLISIAGLFKLPPGGLT